MTARSNGPEKDPTDRIVAAIGTLTPKDPVEGEKNVRDKVVNEQPKPSPALVGGDDTKDPGRAIPALDSLVERLGPVLEGALAAGEELQLAMTLLPNTAELKKYRADLQKRLGVLKGTALDISNKLELK
jgi:hypothetical protein